jgi:hypothetical protein
MRDNCRWPTSQPSHNDVFVRRRRELLEAVDSMVYPLELAGLYMVPEKFAIEFRLQGLCRSKVSTLPLGDVVESVVVGTIFA